MVLEPAQAGFCLDSCGFNRQAKPKPNSIGDYPILYDGAIDSGSLDG